MKRILRCGVFVSTVAVCACNATDVTTPTRAIDTPSAPSFETAEGYVCPSNWIRSAAIPGNIYPYHATTVGSGSYLMPFMNLVSLSATGLEKGRYAIGSGGPFVSDDNKIAIVSGNVTGWCYYLPLRFSGSIDNYTGKLQVTDFDGEIINIPPPTSPNQESSCDDPLTILPEDCSDDPSDNTGSSVGAGGTFVASGTTTAGPTPSKWVCYVTDWYVTGSNGELVYTDTTIDYCYLE